MDEREYDFSAMKPASTRQRIIMNILFQYLPRIPPAKKRTKTTATSKECRLTWVWGTMWILSLSGSGPPLVMYLPGVGTIGLPSPTTALGRFTGSISFWKCSDGMCARAMLVSTATRTHGTIDLVSKVLVEGSLKHEDSKRTCFEKERGVRQLKRICGLFRRASAGQHRQGSWRLDCAVVAQPRADLHRADRHGKRLAARGNLLGTALKRRAARLGSLRLPHKALHVRELGAEYEHTLLLLLAPLTGWLAVSDISVQLSSSICVKSSLSTSDTGCEYTGSSPTSNEWSRRRISVPFCPSTPLSCTCSRWMFTGSCRA